MSLPARFEAFDAEPANSLAVRTDLPPPSLADAGKRMMDVVLALAIGLVFLPLALVCVIALMKSGGPVMFAQPRMGKGGRQFQVYKFRTMVPNAKAVLDDILANDPVLAAEYRRDHKLKDDPRVTRVGKFLRRTSLDELPQLINVLKGEMSIVGPRPVEEFEMTKYGRFSRYYFAQKPGLTGIWQVSGRNDIDFPRRVAMDAYYSRNRNVLMDLVLVLRTVKVVLRGSGAY